MRSTPLFTWATVDSWRDLAARIVAEERAPETAPSSPRLPISVEEGLRALAGMGPPQRLGLASRHHWGQVKADAARIVGEGWAAQAIALGWHPLELFGCGIRTSADFAGLAIWLGGRPVVLIDDASAMVRDGREHAIFNRRSQSSALADPARLTFLWEFGRK